ncbi:hypothetical protein ACJIZ3_019774 [Penstemon smallii]|uniref:Maturase K n=1 Tax=Penstemon smallii TaxID=265156 RepID=A0ABD3T224_9LAMI
MYIDNVQPFSIENFVYHDFYDLVNWHFDMYFSKAIPFTSTLMKFLRRQKSSKCCISLATRYLSIKKFHQHPHESLKRVPFI